MTRYFVTDDDGLVVELEPTQRRVYRHKWENQPDTFELQEYPDQGAYAIEEVSCAVVLKAKT